jgi:AP-3 complex subunit beta
VRSRLGELNVTEVVVAESIVTIRTLMQSTASPEPKHVKALALMLEATKVSSARASLVWLIGEYQPVVPTMGPDALRILLKGFAGEEVVVKHQILNLAAKLFLRCREDIGLMMTYLLDLARYDLSYDVRDKARLIKAFLVAEEFSVI